MRAVVLALVLLNTTGQRGCESSASAEATVDAPPPTFASAAIDVEAKGPPVFASAAVDVEAPPPVVTVDAEASHGGAVVQAGPHPVEVVTHPSGEVYAYPPATVATPARATMAVEVPVRGASAPRRVPMRWVPAERRYVGVAPQVEIVPGPVAVQYTVGGHVHHGHVGYVGVVPVVVDVHAPVVVVDVPVVHVHGKHKKFKHGKHKGWGWGHWHGPPGHHPAGPPGHRRHFGGGGRGHGGHGGRH